MTYVIGTAIVVLVVVVVLAAIAGAVLVRPSHTIMWQVSADEWRARTPAGRARIYRGYSDQRGEVYRVVTAFRGEGRRETLVAPSSIIARNALENLCEEWLERRRVARRPRR